MAVPTRNGAAFNNGNGTHATVSYPAGSSDGDLIILHAFAAWNATGGKTITPSGTGWNSIVLHDDSPSNGVIYQTWWKFRGSETSVTVTASSTSNLRGVVAQVVTYDASTVDSVNPVVTYDSFYNQGTTSTSLPAPTVTTVVDDAQILYFGNGGNTTGSVSTTWPAGTTEIQDNTWNWTLNSVTGSMSVAYEDKETAGTTTSRTATFSSTQLLRNAVTIAVYPPLPEGEYTLEKTTSGSFVVPAGVDEITVHCIGAGGSGAGASGGFSTVASPGGAGGSYARRTFAVEEGQEYNFVVGAPGTTGTGNGGAGGITWFGSNDSSGCVAVGGAGATTSTAGAGTTTGCHGDQVYAGGNGALNNGTTNSGGGGGGAGTTGAGGNASSGTGGTGASLYGGNGANGTTSASDGSTGSVYGGGGSGGRKTSFGSANGGAGGQGIVVIEFEVKLGPSDGDTLTVTDNDAILTIPVPAPGPFQVGQESATGTGANLAIDYPVGSVSGDYVVAVAHFYKTAGATAPAITTPSGWTLIDTLTADGTDPYIVGVYGRFRGSETSVTFVASTGTDVQSIGGCYAYRNVDEGVPVTDAAIVYGLDTDDTFDAPSVTTTSVENRLLKAYISNGQYQATPTVSWDSSYKVVDIAHEIDSKRQVNFSMALGYAAGIGATGTETITQHTPLVAITPLGMVKSTSQSLGGVNTNNKLTGFGPQAGTASSDIVNDALVVNGDGNITVSATVAYSGLSSSVAARIHLNGNQVAQGSATSVEWTGDVEAGDTLELYVWKTTTGSRTVTSATLAYTVNGEMVMFASDDFDGTGPLDSTNWTTDGGGTLVRTNGELDGTGTPSVPLSFAWWNFPAASNRMIVKARVRWNGRNPEHSSAGLCVRADPFQNPLINPGVEHGVIAAFGATFEALHYEDYDESDGVFTGIRFVTGSGGFSSGITKYAENALLELEANGDTYTYRVNGSIRKSGTVSTAIIPEDRRYVGLFVQNDELEPGGGDPPQMLDEFEAWHEVPASSGEAHTFAVVVALQVPQDIQIEKDDAVDLVATEAHEIEGTLTAPTDAADLTYMDQAGAIEHTGLAADAKDLTATEAVTALTADVQADDAKDLTATEAVTQFTGALSASDTHDLTATEGQEITNAVEGDDVGPTFTDAVEGSVQHTGLAGDAVEAADAVTDLTSELSATEVRDLVATEFASTSSDVDGDDTFTVDMAEASSIAQTAGDTGTLAEVEDADVLSERTVGDSLTLQDTATSIALESADTHDVEVIETAFRSSDGILAVPRLVSIRPEDRGIAVDHENRWVTVDPEVRRVVIGAETKYVSGWPRAIRVLPEDRVIVIEAE